MFFTFHIFSKLGIPWARVIIFPPSPYPPFLHAWAFRPLLLPCHSTVPAKALSSFCFMFCCGLVVSPLPCEFSVPGFPCPLFTSLPLSDFASQHSCCTNPFHCIILRASSGHLLPLCLFYFYGFFAKSFGLPRPNYHIFTFQYYLGLLVFRPAH